jgi:class 3 adenylate cyclase
MARATLAVLFSDIEGSTRLLQELGGSTPGTQGRAHGDVA